MKIKKLLTGFMAASILAVSTAIPTFADTDISVLQSQSPMSISTLQLEAIQEKNIGETVVVGGRMGTIVFKEMVEHTADSSFEMTLVQLIPLTRTLTNESVAIGTHEYTTGTYYAYLYGTFNYSPSSVSVDSKSYSFSKDDIFRSPSYSESENIFTKTRTLKLKYQNLTGLGWDNYTISLKCTTAGNVSASGF